MEHVGGTFRVLICPNSLRPEKRNGSLRGVPWYLSQTPPGGKNSARKNRIAKATAGQGWLRSTPQDTQTILMPEHHCSHQFGEQIAPPQRSLTPVYLAAASRFSHFFSPKFPGGQG